MSVVALCALSSLGVKVSMCFMLRTKEWADLVLLLSSELVNLFTCISLKSSVILVCNSNMSPTTIFLKPVISHTFDLNIFDLLY